MTVAAVARLVVITDRHVAAFAGHDLVDVVAAAVDAGAPAVLLRDKDLPAADRLELGRRLQPLVRRAGAQLLVASDAALAERLDADGVHLGASDPPCRDAAGLLVGRSCHHETEVASAREEGATYAFVSPVAASPSKPGYGPPIGAGGVRRLTAAAGPMPVLALGGVTPANAPAWRAAGAHGVAVMGGVLGAADPSAAVRALLDALAVEDPVPAGPTSAPTDPPEVP